MLRKIALLIFLGLFFNTARAEFQGTLGNADRADFGGRIVNGNELAASSGTLTYFVCRLTSAAGWTAFREINSDAVYQVPSNKQLVVVGAKVLGVGATAVDIRMLYSDTAGTDVDASPPAGTLTYMGWGTTNSEGSAFVITSQGMTETWIPEWIIPSTNYPHCYQSASFLGNIIIAAETKPTAIIKPPGPISVEMRAFRMVIPASCASLRSIPSEKTSGSILLATPCIP